MRSGLSDYSVITGLGVEEEVAEGFSTPGSSCRCGSCAPSGDVGAFNEFHADTADQAIAQTSSKPPVWSIGEVADYLATGFWGGTSHAFNVTQGGSISVNITALTSAGQTLARQALNL